MAVRTTVIPLAKFFEHERPQSPPGLNFTVPVPLPFVLSDSANHGTGDAFMSTLTPPNAISGFLSRLKSPTATLAGAKPPLVYSTLVGNVPSPFPTNTLAVLL